MLVVVDWLEGADVAHALALQLVHAALAAFQCDLTAELLRFLYPACDLDIEALDPHGAFLCLPTDVFCALGACYKTMSVKYETQSLSSHKRGTADL